MTAIVDAAPLVALADRNDRMRDVVDRILQAEDGQIIIPEPVTAEVDYLLGRRLGRRARLAFLDDLAAQRFETACLDAAELGLIRSLEDRYAALDAGLADLAIVVLAARFRTTRIVTFDERHFRTLRSLDGANAFTLLPADAAG